MDGGGDRLSPAQRAALNAYLADRAEEILELKRDALDLIETLQRDYMDDILTGIQGASTQELIDKYYWSMSKLVDAIWEQGIDAKEENKVYPPEILDIED